MNGSEIPRQELAERIRPSLRQNSITALIGRGQCCKTTLARQIGTHQPTEYFELDSPSNLERLARPKARRSLDLADRRLGGPLDPRNLGQFPQEWQRRSGGGFADGAERGRHGTQDVNLLAFQRPGRDQGGRG